MGFKNRLAVVLAAGILTIGVPTSALAFQAPAAPAIPAVRQDGQGTYDNMIAALGNLPAELEQLNAIEEMSISNVRVFDADYLASGRDPAALDQAVALHGTQIQDAQQALAGHAIVRSALDTLMIPVEQVVAVDTLSEGDVAIYYQP